MKRTIILFIFCLITISNIKAEWVINRYGFELIKNEAGEYKLKDEDRIKAVNLFDFNNLPADMFIPYNFDWVFLPNYEAYFNNCTTKTYTYKKYDNYNLDLQVDIPEGEGPFPFIVWIHGGGWEGGDYRAHEQMSRFLASHGIAGVRINYSLLPQGGTMARAWSDIQDALTFVKENASAFKLDSDRFGFGGQSAGAHLAAYAAMRTPGTKLLFAMNGAYDLNKVRAGFEPNEHHFQFLGKTPEARYEASPVNFVHPGAPYSVFVYGSGDFYVDSQQHELMIKELDKHHIPHEVIFKKYYAHSSFMQTTDVYEAMLMKLLLLAKSKL